MKRLVLVLLALVLLVSLFACGEKKPDEQTPDEQTPDENAGEEKKDEEPLPVEEVKRVVDYKTRKKLALAEIKDRIVVNGRCPFEEDGVTLLWSNSGFELGGWFYGAFNIYYSNITPDLHLHVVIDGDYGHDKLVTLELGSGFFIAETFRDAGYHTVEIYKAEESWKKTSITAIEFKGELDEEPLPRTMSIEVIGDSISCGTGLLAPNGLDNDAYYAYDSILARSLKAKISIVAVSGWAISVAPTDNTKNLIPRIYGMTCGTMGYEDAWDFENNQADAVIINLGTNDYLAYHDKDRTKLYADANAFLDTVRAAYPDAYIYFTYGMMSTIFTEDFEKLVEDRADAKMRFVRVENDSSGKGGHPDYNAHAEYALQFEGEIRRDLKPSARIREIEEIIARKNAEAVAKE